MYLCLNKSCAVIFLLGLYPVIYTKSNTFNKYINEFVVECPGGYSDAKSVAVQMGFILLHKMIGFDNFFVFKHKSKANKELKFHTHRLKRSTKVNYIQQQIILKRVKRDRLTSQSIKFIDPLYASQWYLIRSQKYPQQADMNVIEAWNMGYTGKGVVVSILDDGIDHRHDDLIDNFDSAASYDINGRDNDPLPNVQSIENRHGTRCAGEVAAKANNSKCGVGVAFNAKIGAVRMLDGEVTDRVEAEALSLNQQHIDIYSGSWGPDDSGQRVEGPAKLAKSAFEKGTKYGRNGLGNIYVWASGNGGNKQDSCACDGYASSIYTISISSVSEYNRRPWYLESCASTLASTYSSGSRNERKIISTDLNNQCATDHTGTSASAPLAAGIIALLLESNRNLTWRDVQYIIILTANPTHFVNGNFILNKANLKVSNWYGFGLMDSGKMVRLGRQWYSVPPQHICRRPYKKDKILLRDKFKAQSCDEFISCYGNRAVNFIEHVILYLKIEYQRRGDLRVHLTSPSGTRSEILPFRPFDVNEGPTTFDIWPLMSVQFWGESASGLWCVEIDNDRSTNSNYNGLWSSFKLDIYGTDKWPIRLKPLTSPEPDKWFDQFERMTVDVTDLRAQSKSHVYIRGHADTSEMNLDLENIECDEECFNNTCSAPGPQFCDSCINYRTYNGVCVSKCPSGSFMQNYTKTCELCHFSCDECIGPGKYNCSRCHVGDLYNFKTKQCQMSINDCPKGFYKGIRGCKPCSANCSVCTSSRVCSECNSSFVLTLKSQCRSNCDIGSYADSRRRCRVCHMDCLTCIDGDSSSCTSCSHGSFVNPKFRTNSFGPCVTKCPPGHLSNHTIGFCFRCHENCKSCTGPSAEMCTDCVPPLELSETGHTCIDPVSYNCKPNEFKSSSGTCEKCKPPCQTCAEDRCTSCPHHTNVLFNKTCVNQCPEEYFAISTLNTCFSCEEYCNSCNNSLRLPQCSHCLRSSNICDGNCKEGEFWNISSTTCQRCHPECTNCIGMSSQNCTSCRQNKYLSSGTCLEKCYQGEYLFKFTNQQLCVDCHESCQNKLCHSDNGRCLQCPYGHYLDVNGLCKRRITCPISDYWSDDQKLCLKCSELCRSCSTKEICTSCPLKFCLDPYHSTCRPCCQLSSQIENCSRCLYGHELCISEESSIISSMSFIFFRYPVTSVLCLAISFIAVFLLIFLYYYRVENVIICKPQYSRRINKASVKYTKLQTDINSPEHSENIYSSDETEVVFDQVRFGYRKPPVNGSMALTTTIEPPVPEENGKLSIPRTDLTLNGTIEFQNTTST